MEKLSRSMEKLGLDIDVGSSPGDMKQANPQEARKLSIQRCIQSLVHACQCRDANCRLPSCQKMKRVVTHTKICKRKTKGDCPICKQIIALCCHHGKHCQETECSVPFCSSIKQKVKQQQIQQRVQQAKLLRRRMAAMNMRAGGGNVQKALQQLAGVPVQQGSQSMLLQQLMATRRSPTTHNQQQEILQKLKSHPPLMAAFIKQRQNAQKQQAAAGGPGAGGPGGPCGAGLGGGVPQQQPPQMLPQQPQLAGVPVQQGSQPVLQLMAALRAPDSHNQQQEILQILESSPPLMAAFIKQRQRAIGVPQKQQMHRMLPRRSKL